MSGETFPTGRARLDYALWNCINPDALCGDYATARKLANDDYDNASSELELHPDIPSHLQEYHRAKANLALVCLLQGESFTALRLSTELYDSLGSPTEQVDFDMKYLAFSLQLYSGRSHLHEFPGSSSGLCLDAENGEEQATVQSGYTDKIRNLLLRQNRNHRYSCIDRTLQVGSILLLQVLQANGIRINNPHPLTGGQRTSLEATLVKSRERVSQLLSMVHGSYKVPPMSRLHFDLESARVLIYCELQPLALQLVNEHLGNFSQQAARLSPSDSEYLLLGFGSAKCLLVLGDAFATNIGPPEIMNMFIQDFQEDHYAPRWEYAPDSVLDFRLAEHIYKKAEEAIKPLNPKYTSRLLASLYLRYGYLLVAKDRAFEKHGAAGDWAEQAERLFERAEDWRGIMTAKAHRAIYGVGKTGDHLGYVVFANSIGRWGKGIGSYSFACGLGHLFYSVGRAWQARYGDPRRTLACLRLAEVVFRWLGTLRNLTSVQFAIARLILAHDGIKCADPQNQALEDQPKNPLPGDTLVDDLFANLNRFHQKALENTSPRKSADVTSALCRINDTAVILVNCASRHKNPGLIRAVRRNLAFPLLEGGLGRHWYKLSMDFEKSEYTVPDCLIGFACSIKQLDILYLLIHIKRCDDDGNEDEKKTYVEQLVAEATSTSDDPLVRLALARSISLAKCNMEAFTNVDRLLVKRIVKFQDRNALKPVQTSSPKKFQRYRLGFRYGSESIPLESESAALNGRLRNYFGADYCPDIASERKSLDSRYWTVARYTTLRDSFYEAVRVGALTRATELSVELEADKDFMQSVQPDLDHIYPAMLWMGYQGALKSATNEGGVPPTVFFDKTIEMLDLLRRKTPSVRAFITFLSTFDVCFILLAAARHFLQQCSPTADFQFSIDFEATNISRDIRLKALQACNLVERTKSSIMIGLLEPTDDWGSNFTGNTLGMEDMLTFEFLSWTKKKPKRILARPPSATADDDAFKNIPLSSDLDDDFAAGSYVSVESFRSIDEVMGSIEDSIPQDTLVLQYGYLGGSLICWSLDYSGLIGLRLTKMDKHVLPMAARKLIADLDMCCVTGTDPAPLVDQPIKFLSTVLLAPFQHLSKYSRLIVVPYEALHHLPFHLLQGPNDGKPLGVTHAVSQIMCLSLLDVLKRRRLVHDGNPEQCGRAVVDCETQLDLQLHYSAEICKILKTTSRLQPPQASTTAIMRKLNSSHILRISAVGVGNPCAPLESYIKVLNGERLRVIDVLKSSKTPPLVDLSCCCETGRGAVAVGTDEFEGFTRAFIAKGTSHVIATLWRVNTLVALEFGRLFYMFLLGAAKFNPSVALQLARRELMKRYPQPSLWGAFVLIGTTDDLPQCCKR